MYSDFSHSKIYIIYVAMIYMSFWFFFTLLTSIFLPAGPKGVFLCVSRRALSWWKHQNLKIFTNNDKKPMKSVLSGHFHPYVYMYGVYLESPIMSEIIQNPSDTLHMHSGMTQSSYCDLLIGFEGVNRKCGKVLVSRPLGLFI